MRRSIPRIVISQVLGFIFFLVLLAVANALIPSVNSPVYTSVVRFFNSNIILFLVMLLVGMVNEIFWHFHFPFNVLAPITGSILSIFILTLIFRLWSFLDSYYVHSNMRLPEIALYVLVFLVVLVAGYVTILARVARPRHAGEEEWQRWHRERRETRKARRQQRPAGKRVDWQDVGDEFRLAFYNLGKSLNRAFEGKRDRRKK